MDWTQFTIMLFAFVGLFTWNRSEGRNDIREVHSILKAIQDEIKDFHGRLCSLEEKVKK